MASSVDSKQVSAVKKVTQGSNKFAVSLYQALAAKECGNVLVSPVSVQMVLALAYTGAKGKTATELAKLLSLPHKIEDTLTGYNALIKLFQGPSLKMANGIFTEATTGVNKKFQDNAEKFFDSTVASLDFQGDAENSLQHINSWVMEKTENKIKDLLEQGDIDSLTRIIMVNALHFKANWLKPFKEENTKKHPFHITKNKSVMVDMMFAKQDFGLIYEEKLKAKILELEYGNEDQGMLLVLPDDIEKLAEVESKLTNMDLGIIKERLEGAKSYHVDVKIAIPKFKMEETLDLNDILKSLGATTMFHETKADFSGLSNEQLYVSKVLQKTFIEVNEKGTEAAAATRSSWKFCCGGLKNEFFADHPFLFILVSGSQAFIVGRIIEPFTQ